MSLFAESVKCFQLQLIAMVELPVSVAPFSPCMTQIYDWREDSRACRIAPSVRVALLLFQLQSFSNEKEEYRDD
jgi:hypothetical protein